MNISNILSRDQKVNSLNRDLRYNAIPLYLISESVQVRFPENNSKNGDDEATCEEETVDHHGQAFQNFDHAHHQKCVD